MMVLVDTLVLDDNTLPECHDPALELTGLATVDRTF
jgi:hypothetical protein